MINHDADAILPLNTGSGRYGKIPDIPSVPPPPQPKPQSGDTVQREIEGVKRTLYNAIDKLEKIQRRDAELTTT
jgi:hypothetical protein